MLVSVICTKLNSLVISMFRQFGLIGKKLGHSFSKKYFTEKFLGGRIHAAYDLYELMSIQEFPSLVANTPSLIGLNVTIPYKNQVIPYLHELSPEAAKIQAVNTIQVIRPDRLVGYNTDIPGFHLALNQLIGMDYPSKAVILGTGGAAASVAFVLEKLSIQYLLVSRAAKSEKHITYEELFSLSLADYPLIINTTPVGMYPDIHQAPHFPYEKIGPAHYVMDLIYNPDETVFLAKARTQGAQVLNGMPMLIEQAEQAWNIWNTKV